MKLTTTKLMKRMHKATEELNKEYDVVTKEMIMDHGKISKKAFPGTMEALKRTGDIFSAKHGQYIATKERY